MLRKILNVLERLAVYATCSLLALITVVLSVQVFTRYVLNSSTPWSEELARFSIVWLTLLGLGVVVRRQEDIRIDILEVYFLKTQLSRRLMGLFVKIMEITFVVVVIRSAFRVLPAGHQQMITGLKVPMSYVYAAFVVGPALTLPFLLERIVDLFMNDPTRELPDSNKGISQ